MFEFICRQVCVWLCDKRYLSNVQEFATTPLRGYTVVVIALGFVTGLIGELDLSKGGSFRPGADVPHCHNSIVSSLEVIIGRISQLY